MAIDLSNYANSKTKKTTLNALSNLLYIGINSIISFLLIRVVLLHMGSDYNGLNSTTSQFISILMIFGSSFANASQVALYKPFRESNNSAINTICSTTNRVFKLSGLVMFVLGLVFAAVYSLTVKSVYPYFTIFLVIAISIVSSVVTSLISEQYKVLFQVAQNEYILTFINIITTIFSQLAAYILVTHSCNIIILRVSYAVFSIIQCILTCLAGRIFFSYINFKQPYDYSSIRGTTEVIISVTTGMIYKSAPVLYLTSYAGTIFTSVYSVYRSIIGIVENVIYAILNAPKNGIGQILSGDDEKQKETVVRQYELASILFSTIMLSVTYATIIPFIALYTDGVTDVPYVNEWFALIIVLYTYIAFIHIPSGTCINLGGHFKAMRNNQLIAGGVLIVLIIIGSLLLNVYGILLANLITGCLLAVLEIAYSRKHILKCGYGAIIKMTVFNFIIGGGISFIEKTVCTPRIINYLTFFVTAFILLIINTVVLCLVDYLLFKEDFISLFERLSSVMMKRKRT